MKPSQRVTRKLFYLLEVFGASSGDGVSVDGSVVSKEVGGSVDSSCFWGIDSSAFVFSIRLPLVDGRAVKM